MLRRILIGIAVLALGVAAFAAYRLLPYRARVEHIVANPSQGFHADYYLYLSPGARDRVETGEPVTILVQPNNSGTNSDDAAVHRNDAWWTGFGRHGIADELEVALLVPAFVRPATDWQIYTHALDRDVLTTGRTDLARLDLQLIAMIDDARQRLESAGLPTSPEVLLQGYSASGMFANRFAALHPDRVRAVAAGSPGGWPIAPVGADAGEALPYPAGVADLESLVGQPFDAATWSRMPQLLVMGNQDDNDGLDFADGWDSTAAAQVERMYGATPMDRWDDAQRLHAAVGANTRFLLVTGVGHDRRALQRHTTEFFRETLGR